MSIDFHALVLCGIILKMFCIYLSSGFCNIDYASIKSANIYIPSDKFVTIKLASNYIMIDITLLVPYS
jgi:hypothetical protein